MAAAEDIWGFRIKTSKIEMSIHIYFWTHQVDIGQVALAPAPVEKQVVGPAAAVARGAGRCWLDIEVGRRLR